MSNDDEDEREHGEPTTSAPTNQETSPSIATAIESSLQAGLRSLSEGLGNLVGEDAKHPSRGHPRPRPSTRTTRTNQQQRTANSERERTRKSESEDCLIDTRRTDDEFVVIADMPGASKDDLTVGINPRTEELVIKKAGTTVGRVGLPWTSSEMQKAWFKNGVLEVYIRSDDAELQEKSSS